MFKKLTGKNQNDYEFAAKHLMDNADEVLFKELVEKDSFLFDFVKQNVANRLEQATNDDNWQSVLKFLKYYSPFYENFIVFTLVKYADEDLTDVLLEKLENGLEDEKIYCAKFFSYVQDPLAIDLLRENSYSANEYLNANCANALAQMGEKTSYNEALERLNSDDEFEQFSAVKFLVVYGNKDALAAIIGAMKRSAMSENIAGEIPYLVSLIDILQNDFENGLYITNLIINGLGEILDLSQVFDYDFYKVLNFIKGKKEDSRASVVLLNAREKFETFTENEEYLFDVDKDTKNEIFEIKKSICNIDKKFLQTNIINELREDSLFVYSALDLSTDLVAIRELLKCNNQTIILKTAEILKSLGNFDDTAKTVALLKITDENIKTIIRAL